MPSKNPAQRFHDIIENLDAIEEFTAGFDLESFKKDRKTVYAVVRALEIVCLLSYINATLKLTGSQWRRRAMSSAMNMTLLTNR
jgi:hypothetical protein